jgi:hypothetical protein
MRIVDLLTRLLDKVSKVGAGCASQVLSLLHLEVLPLHGIPVFQVDVVVSQGLIPDNGLVPDDHVELGAGALGIPGCDVGSPVDPLDKVTGRNPFLLFSAIKEG